MYHSGNDDLVVDEPEIQSIRKPRDHGPPCVAVNLLKGQRKLTNSFDGRIDRISETLTKLGVPFLEPALCLEHFALSGWPKDYLIDISLVEEGRDGEVRHYGKIAGISRRGPRSSRHSVRRHADCDLCTKRVRANSGFIGT